MVTLDKKDFRSESFFEDLKEDLGLNDAFWKKMEKHDSGDEPTSSPKEYDTIDIWITKSQMS